MRMRFICLVGLLMAGAWPTTGASGELSSDRSWLQESYDTWFAGRFEAGMRVTGEWLHEPRRLEYDDEGNVTRTFLGSIYKLHPDEDFQPDFFVNIMLLESLGLQFGWDRMRVDTIRMTDGKPDGTFALDGYSLMLQGRWVNRTAITPYAGLGGMYVNVVFYPEPAWHNGFGGDDFYEKYLNWVAEGAEEWPNGGYQRNLDVTEDSQIVPIGQLGLRADLTDHIHMEMDLRYVPIDVDLHFYLSRYGENFQDSGNNRFPLDMWLGSIAIVGSL